MITQVKCKVGLWLLSTALPLINIYVCTKFNFNPFCTFQDIARRATIMKNKWLWGDNSINIQSRTMDFVHCPSLSSIYKPSFISIPYVLSRIWPGQATIMKKWLWGDKSINIQGRIMFIAHCTSTQCHLSINQVSFKSHL